ncbi:MAG: FAD-dependent oxidoreductase [Pseudomonadales bacterium]|nr:FAD-dependent oxidoreductase [Pseudomonadales bacterium]
MKKNLVVIGNGMVTGRFLDELSKFPGHNYQITVISAESSGTYNRIMLSSVLAGDAQFPEIIQKSPEWFTENQVTLRQGEAVVHVNRASKEVVTSKGNHFSYDHLVFATGSRAATIPAANQDLNNIYPFRSVGDTQKILDHADSCASAIVVGGGFLGLEAAWGLAQRGIKVTVIHRSEYILNRQLDKTASQLLQKKLELAGLHFALGTEVEAFQGDNIVQSVKLNNGSQLNCDIAIIATGITHNAELGWQIGLGGTRAIQVDPLMQTCDPNISAIGECAEIDGQTFGLVEPLWQHAKILANKLCAPDIREVNGFLDKPIATKLKISGVQLFSVGKVNANDPSNEITLLDEKAGIYRKLIIEDQKIVGAVLYGDVRSGNWYVDLMCSKTELSNANTMLLFGQEYLAA